MVPAPQALPTRFPCWCRAVYSWGGESKRDLGFIEGDLIECLNAGDGSWWTGRLRRDKRMMGMFPSNFVQVLDDSFRPASRASSPMPDRSPSPNPFNPPPKEVKAKSFRKPFQSYSAPDDAAKKRAEASKQEGLLRQKLESQAPKRVHTQHSRQPSPEQNYDYGSRAVSPAPSFEYRTHSRGPSPSPYQNETIDSSPPPPPPPHRNLYNSQSSAAPYEEQFNGHMSRAVTPIPPSPGPTGMTPSPLRSAMEDVMSSLEGMGLSRAPESPEQPVDPWSPEAFDQTYTKTPRHKGRARPQTSMGIVDQERHEEYDESQQYGQRPQSTYQPDQQTPQLSNYVERMESRLGRTNRRSPRLAEDGGISRTSSIEHRPSVPPKMYRPGFPMNEGPKTFDEMKMRPGSSIGGSIAPEQKLRHRKSAFEVSRQMLSRTFTTKSTATNSSSGVRSDTTMASSSTQATDRSIMSGYSAGGFSSTSAGSLARKKEALQGRARSAMGVRNDDFDSRPQTPLTGISFHSSHASQPPRSQSQAGWNGVSDTGILGGLSAPKANKRSGFFKKIIDSAKTGAASARSSIAAGEPSRPSSSASRRMPDGVTAIAGGFGNNPRSSAANDMGLGAGADWVRVRQDVNRSNSLSRIERIERSERCQMMDYPVIASVDELYQAAGGDEGGDGRLVVEPTNFQSVNLSLVDKNSRFINSLPAVTTPASLATGYVCRPYRSDVQRLRAIFTWVSEKIVWEGDFEGDVDSIRVIQTKRGCAEEVAVLVMDMCSAVGIHCEVVQGYLKTPGEVTEMGIIPRSNHWWNTVLVDGQWRIMDCSLASPTNPKRPLYSSTGPQYAESWWFLTRPLEICYTHIPYHHGHQHICPPMAHDILLSLPSVCPPYFKNTLRMIDYDTSLFRIEDLEQVHIRFSVPADIECVAEVEARAYTRDVDGDLFESGDIIKKRALAQATWEEGRKIYTVKALLPGDEGQGILKVYAGKRGLMHSIKDIPHPLAFALPIIHNGENPPWEFLLRHPTPHAQRHDLYVAQPQCQQLFFHHTYIFTIHQHPSSVISSPSENTDRAPSPNPFIRPGSAMSVSNSSASGSNPSTSNGGSGTKKPAKLAIQSPGGKILRLMRKDERVMGNNAAGDGDGSWETIIKCGERGVWRGLVLADRSMRWIVFCEWNCV